MNSIERVFASVTGATPDRTPVSLTASLYGAALLKCPLNEYYRKPQLFAEGQSLVAEHCNTDIIFSPFAFSLFAEACGATISFTDKAAPVVKKYIPYTPGERISFDVAKLISHPASLYILDSISELAKTVGKQKVVAAINISPCDLPAMVFGIDKWLHTLLFHKSEAIQIIENLSDYFIEMSRRMYQSGAHLIATSLNFTNPQIVTPPISAYVIPLLTEIFMKVEGVKVIHHGGPDFGDAIKNYVHLNGTVGFVISPRDKIKGIRPLIGDKTILGNIDGPFICKHTKEAVYKKCEQILKDNEGNTRFILSSSNADISYDTPLENILAVSRAAEDYSAKVQME